MLVLADSIYLDPESFSAFLEKTIEEWLLQGYWTYWLEAVTPGFFKEKEKFYKLWKCF